MKNCRNCIYGYGRHADECTYKGSCDDGEGFEPIDNSPSIKKKTDEEKKMDEFKNAVIEKVKRSKADHPVSLIQELLSLLYCK